GVQREGKQPHHHTFVGFGRMPREGERVTVVIMPVGVGDLQVGFENRGFQGHGSLFPSRSFLKDNYCTPGRQRPVNFGEAPAGRGMLFTGKYAKKNGNINPMRPAITGKLKWIISSNVTIRRARRRAPCGRRRRKAIPGGSWRRFAFTLSIT